MYYVQRGRFNKDAKNYELTNDCLKLEYMGAAEYEYGAVPKSYRRVMKNFKDYRLIETDIETFNNGNLLIFCKEEDFEEIKESILYGIENPYCAKRPHRLNYMKEDPEKEPFMTRTNFWWELKEDWMAVPAKFKENFSKAIKSDHKNWWLKLEDSKRQRFIDEATR